VGWQVMMALMAMARSVFGAKQIDDWKSTHKNAHTNFVDADFCASVHPFLCAREEHVPRRAQKKHAQDAHPVGTQPDSCDCQKRTQWMEGGRERVIKEPAEFDAGGFLNAVEWLLVWPLATSTR
jgi:hypothetical protein